MFSGKSDYGMGCGCNMQQCPCPGMSDPCPNMCQPGCQLGPICEPPLEKCVQKDIVHEVQHICPINTRVINNHIFRHTYVPQYTCSEQNVVVNLDEGSCCNFL